MVKLKCHHCGHEWIYKGKNKEYCNCPVRKCMYKVNIKKCEIKTPENEVKE